MNPYGVYRAKQPAPKSLAELVEQAAKFRSDAPVLRKYVDEALRMINAKEVKVDSYPGSGMPSLRAVYKLAAELEKKSATKH